MTNLRQEGFFDRIEIDGLEKGSVKKDKVGKDKVGKDKVGKDKVEHTQMTWRQYKNQERHRVLLILCSYSVRNLTSEILKVRVEGMPVSDCRDDAEVNDLVTHLAEVSIRSVKGCKLFCSTFNLGIVYTCSVDYGRHCHHYVVILLSVDIASCRPLEFLAAHSSCYHLYRNVCRALE